MKVALELQPCCGKRSGIGVYTYELARRVRDTDGLEFYGNVFNFLGRNDNSDALEGIEMPLRTFRLFPYGAYRRIWDILPIPYDSLFPGEADLSIFFNFVVPPRISGKIITTIHDMTYIRFPETMDARNLRRLRQGMERSIEQSDHILTVSEFSKKEIAELLGIPEEKISVVPNAPSVSGDAGDFSVLEERFGIRKPYLLYVGTIEPRKNLKRLIRAFKTLKAEQGIPHQLVLAGGKGWANEEIYKEAGDMPDIVFTGYISNGEKNAMYANASAFVFPSLYEGFGIPPLEAMHFGCPVICADAASLPEVVGDAAILIDPLDETDIAQGIWRVISDEDCASGLIRRGCIREKEFTWERSAEKLMELCGRMLRG